MRLLFKTFLYFIVLLGNATLSQAEVNFLAMADAPYSKKAFYLIEKEFENIPKKAKFIIHLGDIKHKEKKCLEDDYKNFRDLLKQSPIPVFVIPGDNGYDICDKPVEAKKLWDQYVLEFEKHWELKFEVARQKKQKENFAFFIEDTLFVGINHIEKRNEDSSQFNQRLQNNIFWINENLKKHKEQIKALIIFAHDFSGLQDINFDYTVCGNINLNDWARKTKVEYKYFSDNLVLLAQEFKKPILYMHGNHHCFHYDSPYKEATNIKRIIVANIEKLPMVKVAIKGSIIDINKRINDRNERLLEEATNGEVWSQYFLSLEKIKLKKYEEAKKWLLKASKQNFLPAKSKLADINSLNGQNKAQTFKFLNSLLLHKEFKNEYKSNVNSTSYKDLIVEFKRELIDQSKYEVYFLLGVMFAQGFGTPINYKKAIEYFEKAGKNIGNAHYNLAEIYLKGLLDGKRDYKRARSSYEKGASFGVISCKFMLGWINLAGLGIKQNYEKAAEWFEASKSHPLSSYNLGILYFAGMGVPEDKNKAMELFRSAANLGNPQAKKILESLNETKK